MASLFLYEKGRFAAVWDCLLWIFPKMTARLPESATGIARCRAILGGEADPFAHEWDTLAESERAFWLQAARLNRFDSRKPWRELSGDTRCRIKNALFRAASRASVLLAAGAAA